MGSVTWILSLYPALFKAIYAVKLCTFMPIISDQVFFDLHIFVLVVIWPLSLLLTTTCFLLLVSYIKETLWIVSLEVVISMSVYYILLWTVAEWYLVVLLFCLSVLSSFSLLCKFILDLYGGLLVIYIRHMSHLGCSYKTLDCFTK